MKTIIILAILAIIAIVTFMYISGIQISLKPFSIQLPYWHRGVGLFLVAIGLIVYNVGEHAKGYQAGLKKGIEIMKEQFENFHKN